MSKRLPDHTPATLGDVRAVSLVALLAHVERPCETCQHMANLPTPDREPCNECDGSGLILTADGHALIKFLNRHLHQLLNLPLRHEPENGPRILPCSDANGGA